VIGESSRLYRRAPDGLEIVVKAFDISEFDSGEVDLEIENLLNLRHPLIAAPIGFALSEGEGKLKIGRLHAAGGSLAEIISSGRAWWTPTAKAEAIVGIVVALRFAHGLGLLHGGLNSGNVLIDGEGRIQITDFNPMRRDGGFSGDGDGDGDGKGWSPQADVSAFAMLLFEIVTGRPWPPPSAGKADSEVILPPDVPGFVSEMIEGGLRPIARKKLSFIALFETVKANHFRIVSGVDSDEVSAFVSRVESAGQSGKSK
jgi:serine/threonine protein kinase